MKSDSIDQVLYHTLFLQREYEKHHLHYNEELAFYNAVKKGDVEFIKQKMLPLTSDQLGRLSNNSMRNLQYHLIICIALITRFCMEGGMDSETAYTLSDLHIQKIDECSTCQEVISLHSEIVFNYAKRMQSLQKHKVFPKQIVLCMDYIFTHLHNPVSIKELADYVNLNPNYLSSLFKKEVGLSISSYIRTRKIEAAQNMLRYSEFACIDISNYLSFNSHSHFISVFKKQTGITPKQYRDKYYRSNWS
ncbi:AraC family transcriptional regulator [Ruminiclostridium cellobioparum]|jgi:AraC family transcriptional regulator|uniref:AraC family transcriptional regulator n=1 Tax=Ruminiclostridium cellobioparum TaxID=29355 RepID=UPI0028AD8328|nr:AraC family transcriptional regulator [Ruminiclostridium cellobioparum]